jgi:hypothetical protein
MTNNQSGRMSDSDRKKYADPPAMTQFMVVISPQNIMEFEALLKVPDLQKLRDAVLGDIEVVPMFDTFDDKPCVAFCNEDGKGRGMRVNALAQRYWERAVKAPILNDVLVGPIAIIVGPIGFLKQL